MTREEIIIGAGVIAGLVAIFYYERSTNSARDSSENSDFDLPALLAPVATDVECVGKTDAQGNWYGINTSGNCTIEALGGATGSY